MRFVMILLLLIGSTGCSLIPDISHQPTVHNPFPQLSKIAVVPFFNLSAEPSVDGRQFALAYANELQQIPGFTVVPIGITEQAMRHYKITQDKPENFQKLAQLLEVDAVVVGAITDYTPYYPPRCTMRVEWYAANPCYYKIPAGYGLPWGTPDEEFIPAPLVFEAEMELARAQLKTQTPGYQAAKGTPPVEAPLPEKEEEPEALQEAKKDKRLPTSKTAARLAAAQIPVENGAVEPPVEKPSEMPDARAFIPVAPCNHDCTPPKAIEPVLEHTRAYDGNDSEFTEALASYYQFRDDARFGGWQAYLQRSEDFIRFCCRMHLYEMLSARGGAGQTRVVWRWSDDR